MSSPNPPHQTRRSPETRPASIAELADRARDNNWDDRPDLKSYLRLAERYRNAGKAFVAQGDLENAFVEFAKAATLVLERLPTHRQYETLLSVDQRRHLAENGHNILDDLSALKATLIDRQREWTEQHPDWTDSDRTPDSRSRRVAEEGNVNLNASTSARQHAEQEDRRRQDERGRYEDFERILQEQKEQDARAKEELALWRKQREETLRQDEEDRERARRDPSSSLQSYMRVPPSELNNTPAYVPRQAPTPSPGSNSAEIEQRRQQERHQQQQEEMRRREEEITRRRAEERRRQEQDGILRRQQEAEAAARSVRQNIAVNNTPAAGSSTSTSVPYFQMPAPPSSAVQYPTNGPSTSASSLQAPTASATRPPSFLDQYSTDVKPLTMPLETPARYEGDSTDSESVVGTSTDGRRNGKQRQDHHHRTPTRGTSRSTAYPPPITTTSPPPPEGSRILYPQLMSQHQKTQGYVPSLHSMFVPPATSSTSMASGGLLFNNPNNTRPLYAPDLLPKPSQAPQPQPQYTYGSQSSQQPPRHHHSSHSQQQQPQPQYPSSTPRHPSRPSDADRITLSASGMSLDATPDLKTVNVPRECLPRFITIASVNTSMNRETCGLLLGKDRGNKFVVTTLLIPKQHSTSDTCTMDEEELVLQFTEERSLITLGWIHTHPSQSCFMSSVDLHTHSGFQRMLPESFAVVCAPKSNPNFGIFRLTDPPGLKTVLDCNIRDAFHPHPDLPIYTDADKGHVQMKDISLEIVDLR